jgi:hypothetical protein
VGGLLAEIDRLQQTLNPLHAEQEASHVYRLRRAGGPDPSVHPGVYQRVGLWADALFLG